MDPATISVAEAFEALALANEQISKATNYLKSQAKLENEKSSGSHASKPSSNGHPNQNSATQAVVKKSLIPFGSGSLPNLSYASILSETLATQKKYTAKHSPLSFSPSPSVFPPIGAPPIPASLPPPVNAIGKVFMVMGVTDTQVEYKALHKQMDKGVVVKGHMVVVNDVKMRNGLVYFAVSTFTTKHVPGLLAKYVVPIYPFTGDFDPDDSHDVQYRLENEDDTWTPNCGREYRRKTNKDSYLRQDNAFFLPEALTRKSDGEDGGCVRLSRPSLATYLEFLKKENIVEGSQADPLWKVEPPSPSLLFNTPSSGRGRGGLLGGRGGRGSGYGYGYGSGRGYGRGGRGAYNRGGSSRGVYTPHGTPTKSKAYNKYPTPSSHGSSPTFDSTPIPYPIFPKVAGKSETPELSLQDVFGPDANDDFEGWTQVSYSKAAKLAGKSLLGYGGKENVPLQGSNSSVGLAKATYSTGNVSSEVVKPVKVAKAAKAAKVLKSKPAEEKNDSWTEVDPSKAAKRGGGNLGGRGGKQIFTTNPYAGLRK